MEEFIEFYPNARFILTERSLESWTTSMGKTVAPAITTTKSFPLSALRKVDSVIEAFCSLLGVLETVFYHGKTCKSQEGIEASKHDTLHL